MEFVVKKMKNLLIIFLSLLLLSSVFAEPEGNYNRISDKDGSISRTPDLDPALGIREVAEDSSSGGNSGGGGGGGNSLSLEDKNPYVPIPAKEEFEEISIEPLKVVQKKLNKKSQYKFKVKKSEEHKLFVREVNAENVTIEIRSEPIISTFKVGETKFFDLDRNGFDELKITLKSIDYPEFDLIIEELIENIPKNEIVNEDLKIIDSQNSPEELILDNSSNLSNDNNYDNDDSNDLVFVLKILLGVVLITIIIGVIIYYFQHKHNYSTINLTQSEINLLNYIKREREAGYSDNEIKEVCLRSGWSEKKLDDLLRK